MCGVVHERFEFKASPHTILLTGRMTNRRAQSEKRSPAIPSLLEECAKICVSFERQSNPSFRTSTGKFENNTCPVAGRHPRSKPMRTVARAGSSSRPALRLTSRSPKVDGLEETTLSTPSMVSTSAKGTGGRTNLAFTDLEPS